MTGWASTCSTRRATWISAQWDFSEDTYRTLTAVDSAVWCSTPPPMAPGGIEEQTRKLFEVCRLRRADHHFCQQARPRGPRPVRPIGRDRAVTRARCDAGLLADRHGARLPRHPINCSYQCCSRQSRWPPDTLVLARSLGSYQPPR